MVILIPLRNGLCDPFQMAVSWLKQWGLHTIFRKSWDDPPSTHRKFNIAPENGWLEDYSPFGRVTFQGLC